MCIKGLNIDELNIHKDTLLKSKKSIEEKVNSLAKREVNLNSSHEVATLLFDTLKLKLPAYVEGYVSNFRRHHSTSKDVLIQLSTQHELPKLIILWRKISHTISNSIYPIEMTKILESNSGTYRSHSQIDLFTVTGRMNFNDPCLQNIPKDFDLDDGMEVLSLSAANPEIYGDVNAQDFLSKIDEEQKVKFLRKSTNTISMRSLFVPGRNQVYVSADYCQLELRIIANLCRDETMVAIFRDTSQDVFVSLASKWLGLPVKDINNEKRQNVKKVFIILANLVCNFYTANRWFRSQK